MSNKNPINQQAFQLLVTAEEGMTRKAITNRLSTDKARMGRAQKFAVKAGWLFVQTEGYGVKQILRYFTMKHAVDNRLSARVSERKPSTRPISSTENSRRTQDIIDRCRVIDSFWIPRVAL